MKHRGTPQINYVEFNGELKNFVWGQTSLKSVVSKCITLLEVKCIDGVGLD